MSFWNSDLKRFFLFFLAKFYVRKISTKLIVGSIIFEKLAPDTYRNIILYWDSPRFP